MRMLTVERKGDGSFHQTFHWIEKEIFMKLKCNFCVERDGNAVETENWLLVSTPTGDKIACLDCKDALKGSKGHEPKDHSLN